MVVRSKFSVPIPAISIPDFVFQSRDASLSKTPLLVSAEDPERFLSLSGYRDWSRRFAAGLRSSRVEEGDRVFLASHNMIYNAVVFMGTAMAGAHFVARTDQCKNLSVLARVQDIIRLDDDQIIIPLHMERVLLSHPDIQEAVIYGTSPTHDRSSESKQTTTTNGDLPRSQKIQAYVVKANGSSLTARDVENFLAQQAPAMKGLLLSGGVVFMDSIPKTTNHKPNKRLVLEQSPNYPYM